MATALRGSEAIPSINTPLNRRLQLTQDGKGRTVIHKAAKSNQLVAILQTLKTLDQREQFQLLALPNNFGDTAIHYACWYSSAETVKLMLECLTVENQAYRLLQLKGWSNKTPLFFAISRGDTAIVKHIREAVSSVQWLNLLMQGDSEHDTYTLSRRFQCLRHQTSSMKLEVPPPGLLPLTAASPLWGCFKFTPGHRDVIQYILSTVTQSQALILAENLFRSYAYAMRQADEVKSTSYSLILKTVLDNFSPDNQLKLIGETSDLESELKANNELMSILQDYRIEAKIKIIIQMEHTAVRQEEIDNLAIHQNLSPQQAWALSPYSCQYVIPYNQLKSKRYALIMYNAIDRNGAHSEADLLAVTLRNTGCEVVRMEWKDVFIFKSNIISVLEEISKDCSLLIVCIMAHGKVGMVTGKNNTQLPISDVLHIFQQFVPEPVPMIMIIQACQSFAKPWEQVSNGAQEHVDASKVNPADNKHIVLVRPHTVLLLSAVAGGEAIRGALTGALAHEFRNADGEIDILSTLTRAIRAMKETHSECSQQTPEIRSTLQRFLVLPPVIWLI